MRINLIAAVANNNVIGCNGGIPWYISDDFKHFKATTMGFPLIMGRKTFESLPGVLPGRPHIILTRDEDYPVPHDCYVVHELSHALGIAEHECRETGVDEVFVIGGGAVYKEAMPMADSLYITDVDKDVEGDVYFPRIDPDIWYAAWGRVGEGPVPHYFVKYIREDSLTDPS